MGKSLVDEGLDHLDFLVDSLPCEMIWGTYDVGVNGKLVNINANPPCGKAGNSWLTFVSPMNTVVRRVACQLCISRCSQQDRTIDVKPLGI